MRLLAGSSASGRSPWSRSERIAGFAAAVAVVGIVLAVLLPEVRAFLGLTSFGADSHGIVEGVAESQGLPVVGGNSAEPGIPFPAAAEPRPAAPLTSTKVSGRVSEAEPQAAPTRAHVVPRPFSDAVIAVDGEGRPDLALEAGLSRMVDAEGNPFPAAFIIEGFFDAAFLGDSALLESVGLRRNGGSLYLAKKVSVVEQTDWPADGLFRAETILTVRQFQLDSRLSSMVHSARGLAAAYSRGEALRRAEASALEVLEDVLASRKAG